MTDKAQDFSAFLLDLDATVEITLPDGEPMLYAGEPVKIVVHSPASPEYAKAAADRERFLTGRAIKTIGGKGKIDDDVSESLAKFLTAITKDVQNFPWPGGAGAIYREPRLKYVADQVDTFAGRLGNFFGSASKS